MLSNHNYEIRKILKEYTLDVIIDIICDYDALITEEDVELAVEASLELEILEEQERLKHEALNEMFCESVLYPDVCIAKMHEAIQRFGYGKVQIWHPWIRRFWHKYAPIIWYYPPERNSLIEDVD